MQSARLTLKNYRGFADTEPVVFEFGPGFTSFVGKNNVGKSSLKLFFYELRQLFSFLARPQGQNPNISASFGQILVNIEYQGISDLQEIFHNRNNRPLSFELEIFEPKIRIVVPVQLKAMPIVCLTKIVGACERRAPTTWTLSGYSKGIALKTNAQVEPVGDNAYRLHGTNRIVDCHDLVEVIRSISESRYYGAFRNAINQGSADYYDLKTGTAFIQLWNIWKTSGNKAQARAIGEVTESIRRLFEFGQLEINTSDSLKTLMVTIDQQPYRLAELGSGIAQFIIVMGNAATAPPSFVLIDEPETNLHPALQIDFLLALAGYARSGIIFSTHSIGLARSVSDRIFSFRKEGNATRVAPFEATQNYAEFVGELSFSTFKDLGSDKLLLVEGVHEVKAIQQLLRLVKKEHTTVILPLGGNQLAAGGRDVELGELTRLSKNIFAFVDSERDEESSQPLSERRAFAETCERLGIKVQLSDRRAFENYFSDRAVKAALGQSFAALQPFQQLRAAANPWSKGDNWRIARLMELGELEGTDLGRFLQSI
jgi:hypothetical protein